MAEYANQLVDNINLIKMALKRDSYVAHGPMIMSLGTAEASLIRSICDLYMWQIAMEAENTEGDFLPETSKEVINMVMASGLHQIQPTYSYRLALPKSMVSMHKRIWSSSGKVDLPSMTGPVSAEMEASLLNCLAREVNSKYGVGLDTNLSVSKDPKLAGQDPKVLILVGGRHATGIYEAATENSKISVILVSMESYSKESVAEATASLTSEIALLSNIQKSNMQIVF